MSLSTETMTAKGVEAAPVRKFMFERSFDDATVVHRAAERKPVVLKPEQVDAMKKESYDSGFEAGKVSGKEEQTAQLTAVLATVEKNIDMLVQNLAALKSEQDTQTRTLVLAIAKKILPDFTAKNGLQEIEAVLSEAIREMAREPRLVVRINESQFDAVDARVQAIVTQRAYSGKVIVLADAEIAAGDCRVEWADGGVERDTKTTMHAIEQTINPSA